MKKIVVVFLSLFIIESVFVLTHNLYENSALTFVNSLIRLPLVLIDRSYPFYAGNPGLV